MTSPDEQDFAAKVARHHGLSEAAGRALWEALRAGRGRQAQFSHPDLGGMGQWSGGMLQIGDMFDTALKAKVLAACAELGPLAAEASPGTGPVRRDWWPDHLGHPASTGQQNESLYAVFPSLRRLALRQGGVVTLYDTADHRITGVSQQQGSEYSMTFTSQFGAVRPEDLRQITDEHARPAEAPTTTDLLPGGCLCGEIRYEARGVPFHATLCHCSDCRRAAGAPSVAWFTVKRADFRVMRGVPKLYRSSARALRRFCPTCGTPLTFEADAHPNEIDITTASLDEPAAVPPRDHAYAQSRIAWDRLDDRIPVRAATPKD